MYRRYPWKALLEKYFQEQHSVLVIVIDYLNRQKKRMCIGYSATVNIHTQLDAYQLQNIDSMINEYFSIFDLKSAYHKIGIKDSDKPFTAFEANNKLYQFTHILFGVSNGVASFQSSWQNVWRTTIGRCLSIHWQHNNFSENKAGTWIICFKISRNDYKKKTDLEWIKICIFFIMH